MYSSKPRKSMFLFPISLHVNFLGPHFRVSSQWLKTGRILGRWGHVGDIIGATTFYITSKETQKWCHSENHSDLYSKTIEFLSIPRMKWRYFWGFPWMWCCIIMLTGNFFPFHNLLKWCSWDPLFSRKSIWGIITGCSRMEKGDKSIFSA